MDCEMYQPGKEVFQPNKHKSTIKIASANYLGVLLGWGGGEK